MRADITRIGPAADLLGENEVRLLLELHRRTEPLSGRRLAALASVPPSSAHRILERLVGSGLVISTRSSHAVTYLMNRHHVLYEPIVLEALAAPAKIGGRLAEIVRQRAGTAVTAALFGSVSRDEARPDSDLDVLIVTPDDFDQFALDTLMNAIMVELKQYTGREVQVFDVDRAGFQRMVRDHDPLISNLAEDAETVIGTDVNALIRAGS